MKHPYFRTITLGSIAGGVAISIYLIFLSLIYKDPLNATPKSFDFLLYLALPVASVVYYKNKLNGGQLKFLEGMVAVSLINAFMLLCACITIWAMISIQPDILQSNIQNLLDTYTQNKEEVMKKLQSEEDYQNLLARTKLRTVGVLLFEEAGFKLILGFFTSIVAATAFRK